MFAYISPSTGVITFSQVGSLQLCSANVQRAPKPRRSSLDTEGAWGLRGSSVVVTGLGRQTWPQTSLERRGKRPLTVHSTTLPFFLGQPLVTDPLKQTINTSFWSLSPGASHVALTAVLFNGVHLMFPGAKIKEDGFAYFVVHLFNVRFGSFAAFIAVRLLFTYRGIVSKGLGKVGWFTHRSPTLTFFMQHNCNATALCAVATFSIIKFLNATHLPLLGSHGI